MANVHLIVWQILFETKYRNQLLVGFQKSLDKSSASRGRQTANRRLPRGSSYFRLPNQTSLPPTRMVGAGNVHSLLWTFLRLRNTCKLASMNIHSDRYGDLTVSLRMVTAGLPAPPPGGLVGLSSDRHPHSHFQVTMTVTVDVHRG